VIKIKSEGEKNKVVKLQGGIRAFAMEELNVTFI
jgi:hypothetical protein